MEKKYRICALPEMLAMTNYYGKTEEDKATMNLPFVLYLKGKIDVKRLEDSIKKVLNEGAMHTYLTVEENKFFAHEKENFSFNLEVEDACGSSTEEKISNVKSFAEKVAKDPLPIFQKEKQLSYFRLFKVEEEYHILVMIVHHTFIDFAAIMIIFHLLFGYYNDDNFELEKNADFSEFMEKELLFFESEDAQKEEEFWNKELKDVINHELEVETPVLNEPSISEEDLITFFDRKEVMDLAAKNRTSAFNIIMLIIHMAIAKVNGSNDILTQYAISNRSDLKYRYTLGCLTRILNNRVNFDDDMNVREMNKVMRKKIGDGYQNRHIAGKNVLGSIPYIIANEDMSDLSVQPTFNGKPISFDFIDLKRTFNYIAFLILPIGTDKMAVNILTDALAYGRHSKQLIKAMELSEKFIVNYPDKTFGDFMRKDITLETLDLLKNSDDYQMIEI